MVEEIFHLNRIKELLPYRYPMLLVDRLHMVSDTKYIGLKNLSFNEEIYQGHFPGHPILPGVFQVEAMQQVAEIAVKDKLDPKGQNNIYIKSLHRVKFRRPALPGDRLQIEIEVKKIENNEVVIAGVNRTASGVTCQATITLSVRPRINSPNMPVLFTDIDKNDGIAMDINQIMAIIPHRFPFLLVDYIVSVEGTHVVAVKNTTINEPIFHGYSADYAILPVAIQAEIIAQAGAVLMLSRPENQGKIAYFMSIEKSESYHPVYPGDQLKIDVEVPEGHSRFGRGDGFISVDGNVASRTEITFAVVEP